MLNQGVWPDSAYTKHFLHATALFQIQSDSVFLHMKLYSTSSFGWTWWHLNSCPVFLDQKPFSFHQLLGPWPML